MAKLGYTWYPKDWGNSESVFELTLSERGLYRELIDLAMMNDNTTEIKLDVWSRKFAIDIDGLKSILGKLIILNLIEVDGEKLFIPSCESRLNLVRGGTNGGKKSKPPKKPTSKPNKKPIESLDEKNEKPTPKQIETKTEIESKVNEIKINSKEYYRKFAHLELSNFDFKRLLDAGNSKELIDDVLNRIENYAGNKKYLNHYMTALSWINKDKKNSQTPTEGLKLKKSFKQ